MVFSAKKPSIPKFSYKLYFLASTITMRPAIACHMVSESMTAINARHREVIRSRCAKQMEFNGVALIACKGACARPGFVFVTVRVNVLGGGSNRAIGTDADRGNFRAVSTIASSLTLDITIVSVKGTLPTIL